MHKRRAVLIVAGLLAVAAFAQPPSADIRILTHDTADVSPRSVQAALDLGIVALDVLVTWTGEATKR